MTSPGYEESNGRSTDFATEVYVNMLRTTGHLVHEQSRLLKEFGLSRTQFDALRILRASNPEGTPILEIANRMISRVPDITRLIDRLERDGLVKRHPARHDRRVILVKILHRAIQLLDKLEAPLSALTRDQIGHLSQQELETLNRLLLKARSAATA